MDAIGTRANVAAWLLLGLAIVAVVTLSPPVERWFATNYLFDSLPAPPREFDGPYFEDEG